MGLNVSFDSFSFDLNSIYTSFVLPILLPIALDLSAFVLSKFVLIDRAEGGSERGGSDHRSVAGWRRTGSDGGDDGEADCGGGGGAGDRSGR